MVTWTEGIVLENKSWTTKLHSLRVKATIQPFSAGQFTQLALKIDGELVSRPFSLVNAPDDPVLDFYFIHVPDGVLSPRLASLKAGDTVQVAEKATGLLTLEQLPPANKLFLLATGTGVGPFLSILKTETVWQQFDQVCLLHAVRFAEELSYSDTIKQLQHDHADQFRYVTVVSRESHHTSLGGRIPDLIEDDTLSATTGMTFDDNSQVLICGNPGMIQETMDVLTKHGLKRHTRREPGQISIEKYWSN
ncbi:Ferredoxin--NADP(+) reductase [Methylophaga frappieri]|uniref:ferredoxin--NADP(+) reductase n=1 Tax=Methylophaga frappieri (strain ATCC BAA-2434 / DSM 25690 / JAM7) TaxID=754477 RepID=I1YFZ6_METFJ|nr:ferredoxin--NADP reductase [Methylophaga frappieri]AFJ01839.1 Ferredoxin--NADP(+) reductase [Methylophaga frappieri]